MILAVCYQYGLNFILLGALFYTRFHLHVLPAQTEGSILQNIYCVASNVNLYILMLLKLVYWQFKAR